MRGWWAGHRRDLQAVRTAIRAHCPPPPGTHHFVESASRPVAQYSCNREMRWATEYLKEPCLYPCFACEPVAAHACASIIVLRRLPATSPAVTHRAEFTPLSG